MWRRGAAAAEVASETEEAAGWYQVKLSEEDEKARLWRWRVKEWGGFRVYQFTFIFYFCFLRKQNRVELGRWALDGLIDGPRLFMEISIIFQRKIEKYPEFQIFQIYTWQFFFFKKNNNKRKLRYGYIEDYVIFSYIYIYIYSDNTDRMVIYLFEVELKYILRIEREKKKKRNIDKLKVERHT